VVEGNWPDDSLSARIARCIIRKYIDVVALVDGMYWVIKIKPIAMARANAGSGDIQGDYRQLQSGANAGSGIQGELRQRNPERTPAVESSMIAAEK